MAIDIASEQLLTLAEATKALPRANGRRIHVSTVYRWTTDGILARNGQRIRLEAARLGRRVMTSREALGRFANRTAEADAEERESVGRPTALVPRRRTDRQRQRDIEHAERVHDAFGTS